MKISETEIYKMAELALAALYALEDLTQYEDKNISKAVSIMQDFDIQKACDKYMIVVDTKKEKQKMKDITENATNGDSLKGEREKMLDILKQKLEDKMYIDPMLRKVYNYALQTESPLELVALLLDVILVQSEERNEMQSELIKAEERAMPRNLIVPSEVKE